MGSDEARKKSSRKHRSPRRRRSSNDRGDCHARAEAMLQPNPSANTALARRHRPATRYKYSATNSEATDEHASESEARRNKRTSSQPQQAPFFVPSDEDLRRLQAYVQLKVQAEGIQPAPGHIYRGVKVHDNARIVQGNVFDSDRPEQQLIARRHEYHNFEAGGGSLVWTGDMTHKSMATFINQQRINKKGSHRHYGD